MNIPRLFALAAVIIACGLAHGDEIPLNIFSGYDARDLCLDLAAGFSGGDTSTLTASIDLDNMAQVIGIDRADPETRNELIAEMKSRLIGPMTTHLLAHRQKWQAMLHPAEAGRYRCTLAPLINASGTTIIDVIVEIHDGRPAVVDMINYTTGSLSSLLQRFVAASAQGQPSPLTPRSRPPYAPMEMAAFNTAVLGKDPETIHRAFLALPDTYRSDPEMISVYATAVASNSALYDDALAQLAAGTNGSGNIPPLLLDYFYKRGEYDKLQAAMAQLRQRTGPLPPVYMMGALYSLLSGDKAGFRKDALALLDADDGEKTFYLIALVQLAKHDDLDTALLTLEVLSRRFHYDFSRVSVEKLPDLRPLLESPQYKEWLRTAGR